MFERFTDRARRVVKGARAEARQLNHQLVGTEHLLLALLDDQDPDGAANSLAARVLREAGVDQADLRARIIAHVGQPPQLLTDEDAEALREIGIDLDAVRAKLTESFGEGVLRRPTLKRRRGFFGRRTGEVLRTGSFSPRAKKALELSLREAIRLKHNYIGTEHLLLGLVREGEGLAAQVLAESGVRLEDLRGRVLAALRTAA